MEVSGIMAAMRKDDMKRALFGTYPNTEMNTDSWKSFKIGDWFDIHPTKAYKLTNRDLFSENGVNPVIGNSSFNNGITGYSNLDTTESNIITFSDTTSGTNTMFYQDMNFIGYPHVQGMYALEDKNIVYNKYTALFIISSIRGITRKRFDYVDKMNRNIISNMEIKLPSKNSEPDWAYMEQYMKDTLKLAEERLQILQNVT